MVTEGSLRKRLEGLQAQQDQAIAQVNANAGAIALCEELLKQFEEGKDALTTDDLRRALPGCDVEEPRAINGHAAD